jgi:hypothetical protein
VARIGHRGQLPAIGRLAKESNVRMCPRLGERADR